MKLYRFRLLFILIHDLAAVSVAWVSAFLLRFNFDIPNEHELVMHTTLCWVVIIDGFVFLLFRQFLGLWRYTSIHEIRLLCMSVGVAALSVPFVFELVYPLMIVPRSVYILHPLLLLLLLAGGRLLYRSWQDRTIGNLGSRTGKPVVVLGAGDAATLLIRDLSASTEWRIVGVLDDDTTKIGHRILGTMVLGKTNLVPQIAEKYGVSHAIIAMPSVSHSVRKALVDLCQSSDIKVLTVPSFDDLMSGKVLASEIRDVELDDLLGRDPIELDSKGLQSLLEASTVLVTGAGGSIGSELCRQLTKFMPSLLIVFDISEYHLYQIEIEFHEYFPEQRALFVLGDIKNESRINHVLKKYQPKVIFHAAAYKHVPLTEINNTWEAVQNNVLGTLKLARAAILNNVQKFVLVSTDKAVNPTNVMGATKRLAEMVCQEMHERGATHFIIVRFGNVLGSTGSVIPRFKKQIAQGGPVTVTHPEVTRFFMTIPEASQLVLQASLMGRKAEIFALDMGSPVRIYDLALEMIRLSGFQKDEIEIKFIGLRAGEKLYEEVLADGEDTQPTVHPKLFIARSRPLPLRFLEELEGWLSSSYQVVDSDVRRKLISWIPEYKILTSLNQNQEHK